MHCTIVGCGRNRFKRLFKLFVGVTPDDIPYSAQHSIPNIHRHQLLFNLAKFLSPCTKTSPSCLSTFYHTHKATKADKKFLLDF